MVIDVVARDALLTHIARHAPHTLEDVIIFLRRRIHRMTQVTVDLSMRTLGHHMHVEFHVITDECTALFIVRASEIIPYIDGHE